MDFDTALTTKDIMDIRRIFVATHTYYEKFFIKYIDEGLTESEILDIMVERTDHDAEFLADIIRRYEI